jgi:hypothetical protein
LVRVSRLLNYSSYLEILIVKQTNQENKLRFEIFTAMIIKNSVIWVMEAQFVLHKGHITSPLQSPASYCYVRFEVTVKNALVCYAVWLLKKTAFHRTVSRPSSV